jgi:hypothetical protein
LPLVSTTPAVPVAKFAAGVLDTGGKFVTGVVDISGKFATDVVDTGSAIHLQISPQICEKI